MNSYQSKRALSSCESNFRSGMKVVNNEAQLTSSWWAGIAGRAFREEWRDIDQKGRIIETQISNLRRRIDCLEQNVFRAQREREKRRQRELKEFQLMNSKKYKRFY